MTPPPSPPHRAIATACSSPRSEALCPSPRSEPLLPPLLPITLAQPSSKQPRRHPSKAFRVFRSVIRSFPILTPTACRFHSPVTRASRPHDGHISGAARTTGTLYGHRKGRITLAIQDTPGSIPILLLELAILTSKFIQEMSSGLLRLALECEKRAEKKGKLLDEPLWTAFVNGRKIGCAAKREATDTDLVVMQMLHAVSMGAGVLPGEMTHSVDGELTYMRAHFDRVVGSRDSETFYMLNPDEKTGPELSIFFVRV